MPRRDGRTVRGEVELFQAVALEQRPWEPADPAARLNFCSIAAISSPYVCTAHRVQVNVLWYNTYKHHGWPQAGS